MSFSTAMIQVTLQASLGFQAHGTDLMSQLWVSLFSIFRKSEVAR